MSKETRGRKAKTYKRKQLTVPVDLVASFKRQVLDFELALEEQDKLTDKHKQIDIGE